MGCALELAKEQGLGLVYWPPFSLGLGQSQNVKSLQLRVCTHVSTMSAGVSRQDMKETLQQNFTFFFF